MTRNRIAGLHRIVSELWRDGKGWILIVVAVGWFISLGVRYAYPALLPFFQDTFNVSLTTVSLLVSVLWIAYAIGQFPGGMLGDRFGEGNILVVSTALSGIGLALVAISNTVYVLFVGTMAFGIATALYGPTRFTIFTDIYAERSGIAIGFTMAAGSVGNASIPVLAVVIASYGSWRLGFGALVPLLIIITIALWFIVPSRTSHSRKDDNQLSIGMIREIIRATRRHGIPILVSAHVVAAFVSQGFLALYPTYLVIIKGLSPSVAATLYSVYFAFGILVQPLAGMSRDHFGDRATLSALLGIYFISLLLLPFMQGLSTLAILTVCLSSRNGVGVITNTFISASLPQEIKGSGLGFLRTIWILIGATSPAFVGFFADSGYFVEVFGFLAILAGVAVILSLFVPKN